MPEIDFDISAWLAGRYPEKVLVSKDQLLRDHATVPLVIYIKGQRRVIGEATISGETVYTELNDGSLAAEVMDILMGDPQEAQFSIGLPENPPPLF